MTELTLDRPVDHYTIIGDYAFFYRGAFSQWWPSEFNAESIRFNCAEQYMMFKKAMLFGDVKTAADIINEKSPEIIKSLGREVKNFDEYIWNSVKRDIVYKGNYYKFTQNNKLKKILLSTKTKVLAEASPYDKIWGIGRSVDYPNVEDNSNWLGNNSLGYELTRLKFKLMS